MAYGCPTRASRPTGDAARTRDNGAVGDRSGGGNDRDRRDIMILKRAGSQPSQKGPADYFSGNVRIDP
jgi:hypothetical protein